MATKNVMSGSYEPMDKLPSNTLKRHPKMELNKTDLLRLLSYLEGELQGRDITIAALKAEKSKQLLYQAKYGRFGLGDPFHALQRDSDCQKDNSFDENAVKAMYDNQLTQLENLIATQRKAQLRMRDQLAVVEKRYHKVCNELEEEKKKHALDTAQGDDVTYMLEKERERLKQEVEFEKGQNKKTEKELKKVVAQLEEERAISAKHKQVAIMLIKERKRLVDHMSDLTHRQAHSEHSLAEEKRRMKSIVDGLTNESQRTLQMEAAMEKQLSEWDVEREQLKAKLRREESRTADLAAIVERLQHELEALHAGTVGVESKGVLRPVGEHRTPIPVQVHQTGKTATPSTTKVFKHTPPNTPPEVRRTSAGTPLSPERDHAHHPHHHKPINTDSNVKRAIMQFSSPKAESNILSNKPAPAEKPLDLAASRINVVGPGGSTVLSAPSGGGSTVFTTPSGTRISLNVGPSPSSTASTPPRGGSSSGVSSKTSAAAGRVQPPPVPPNKPAYVPTPISTPSKALTRTIGPSLNTTPATKPQPPSKFGITISKDKITISNPDGPNDGMLLGSGQRPLLSAGQSAGEPRKPSQPTSDSLEICDTATPDTTAPPPADSTTLSPLLGDSAPAPADSAHSETATTPNLDLFGSEMDDLQQLLVSMVTGASESSSHLLTDHPHSSSSSPSSSLSSSLSSGIPSVTKSSSQSSPSFSSEVPAPSTFHLCAMSGDCNELYRLIVNEKEPVDKVIADGSTALYSAAEAGEEACVKMLLEHGAKVNILRHDGSSALHAAAGEGHYTCLEMLLDQGGAVDQPDQAGWTPLYWSATNGHPQCCRLLLDYGAAVDTCTTANWTPLHGAVHSGHADCLRMLIGHQSSNQNENSPANQSHHTTIQNITNMADKDGWTISHLAAIRETTDCLQVLLDNCVIDLESRDKWGRTVMEVASTPCQILLESIDKQSERTCLLVLQLSDDGRPSANNTSNTENQAFHIATLKVTSDMSWTAMEHLINGALGSHLNAVSVGLKTKKTSRADSDSPELSLPYSLGLSTDSIKCFVIGEHCWYPGAVSNNNPFEVLCNNDAKQINIVLKGWEDGCLDSIAYETLVSLSMLQNYHRLIEQYRSVVLYGPAGTGKTFLARKLAHCIQDKEVQKGHQSMVHSITFHEDLTHSELVNILLEKGCLIRSSDGLQPPSRKAPILLLEDLQVISVSDVFGDLLKVIEFRGPQNSVHLITDGKPEGETYYLLDSCYIIGTMNKSRSTGLELSIQQRFRWVHLRNDVEPIKNLLHRHLYRKMLDCYGGRMPSSEDLVYRAVEWVICVWQRLNDGLTKLALSELVFGPSYFLTCPITVGKPKAIHKWLTLLWNHKVAPAVSEAVIRGSGTDIASPGGHQKVANTALYVLMQRAVVSGCPLSGQEKERYLSSFHGSNELDIKMRLEKRSSGTSVPAYEDVNNKVNLSSTHPPDVTISMPMDSPDEPPPMDFSSLGMEEIPPHLRPSSQGSYIAVVGKKQDDPSPRSLPPKPEMHLSNPSLPSSPRTSPSPWQLQQPPPSVTSPEVFTSGRPSVLSPLAFTASRPTSLNMQPSPLLSGVSQQQINSSQYTPPPVVRPAAYSDHKKGQGHPPRVPPAMPTIGLLKGNFGRSRTPDPSMLHSSKELVEPRRAFSPGPYLTSHKTQSDFFKPGSLHAAGQSVRHATILAPGQGPRTGVSIPAVIRVPGKVPNAMISDSVSSDTDQPVWTPQQHAMPPSFSNDMQKFSNDMKGFRHDMHKGPSSPRGRKES